MLIIGWISCKTGKIQKKTEDRKNEVIGVGGPE